MTSERDSVLFLFAHQDDEAACVHHLLMETSVDPGAVTCVFATNGEGNGTLARIRDEESLRALESLGVRKGNIHFLGSSHEIPDGSLVEHLHKVRAKYLDRWRGAKWRRIYCPAWEGGHPDHDATHLLALAIASDSGCREVWEFGIYHGASTAWKFFRMLRPIRRSEEFSCIHLSYMSIFRQIRLFFLYKSQRRSWFFFLPDALFNLLSGRRELCQRAHETTIQSPPHEGALLYERIFGFPFSRFKKAQDDFMASGAGRSS